MTVTASVRNARMWPASAARSAPSRCPIDDELAPGLGAILVATIPLWVVLLSGLIGTPVSVASQVRARGWVRRDRDRGADGANSAIGGPRWTVAAFVVAPILWAAGTLLTTHADRAADRAVATAVQLLAGGTVLLLLALSLGELDPARWSDVSSISVGAAAFLLVFDSLVGFMLDTRLLADRAGAAGQYLCVRHAACRRRDGRDCARRVALGRRICRRALGARSSAVALELRGR